MKIVERNWPEFAAKPPKAIRVFLCYGQDYGLVAERCDALVKNLLAQGPSNPFRLRKFSYEQLKADASQLAEALGGVPLGGGDSVVVVRDLPTAAAAKELFELLPQVPNHSSLILSAGELTPAHNVRKLCEAEQYAAAIACYNDGPAAIRELLQTTLVAAGRTITPEAAKLFTATVVGDRQLIRNEIEKLLWYTAHNTHPITEDEVAAVNCGNDESSLDELLHAYFSGNKMEALKMLSSITNAQASPIPLLRSILRYVQRLETVQMLRAEGQNIETALAALRPPVFFKHVDQFKQALGKWDLSKLRATYQDYYALEQQAKLTLGNQAWDALKMRMFADVMPV